MGSNKKPTNTKRQYNKLPAFVHNMTGLQQSFCEALVKQKGRQNAKKAYIKAGSKARGNAAAASAAKLLTLDNVKNYISYLRKPARKKAKYGAEQVLADFQDMAQASISKIFSWTSDGKLQITGSKDLPESFLKCIKKIKPVFNPYGPDGLEFELYDRQKAMTALAKFYNMEGADPERRDALNLLMIQIDGGGKQLEGFDRKKVESFIV